jgi:hypothetical protein
MNTVFQPWQLIVVSLAETMNRKQKQVIAAVSPGCKQGPQGASQRKTD